VSSRQHAVKDRELNSIVRLPATARDAWCMRRHEELAAEDAIPTIHAKALAALRAIEIEP
jgi:hypothetical protein